MLRVDHFGYVAGELRCEDAPAAALVQRFGSPLYVYSRATLEHHFSALRAAFAPLNPLICFSIKSCPNVHICRMLRELGSGFDVVSGGELHRALLAGADPASIVFAGVGKSDREIGEALAAGVGLFNVESESELELLGQIARERGSIASAALRVNPDVDPKTHRYTTTGKKATKFGVDLERAREVFRAHAAARSGASAQSADARCVNLRGLHVHLGSPVNDLDAYRESVRRCVALIEQLRQDGCGIDTLDLGGGFAADYLGDAGAAFAPYAHAAAEELTGRGLRIVLEPGRAIAANAGVLLARVVHVKQSGEKRFVIVDAAMNDLIRPALYGAYHFVWPASARGRVPTTRRAEQPFDGLLRCDVVGPVCESGDFLAQDRLLPPVHRGDVLAIFTAGAYGMSMSSQYNSRPRAAEVLVSGSDAQPIRRRETYEDLVRAELEL